MIRRKEDSSFVHYRPHVITLNIGRGSNVSSCTPAYCMQPTSDMNMCCFFWDLRWWCWMGIASESSVGNYHWTSLYRLSVKQKLRNFYRAGFLPTVYLAIHTNCSFSTSEKCNLFAPYIMESYPINRYAIKFLGIHLDTNIRWEQHVISLSKQLSSAIYALRRISCFLVVFSCFLVFLGFIWVKATIRDHFLGSFLTGFWGFRRECWV